MSNNHESANIISLSNIIKMNPNKILIKDNNKYSDNHIFENRNLIDLKNDFKKNKIDIFKLAENIFGLSTNKLSMIHVIKLSEKLSIKFKICELPW